MSRQPIANKGTHHTHGLQANHQSFFNVNQALKLLYRMNRFFNRGLAKTESGLFDKMLGDFSPFKNNSQSQQPVIIGRPMLKIIIWSGQRCIMNSGIIISGP